MYSAKINDEATTFGTSGLLYRSNKVMYDRRTRTLWHQFTGEPIIGPLSDSGIKLDFFPVLVTTWGEWAAEHPDTTVLSINTGIYAGDFYLPESDSQSVYYRYFNSPETMFPVWKRDKTLEAKQVVMGLSIEDAHKAYPVDALQQERVVNDELGGTDVVIVASAGSESARAYERQGRRFTLVQGEILEGALAVLVDAEGVRWQVTEEHVVSTDDPSQTLNRLPTHMSFWFGWYQFHPDTAVYEREALPAP